MTQEKNLRNLPLLAGKISPGFLKGKKDALKVALKQVKKYPDSSWSKRDVERLNEMKGYPENSSDIRNMDVRVKAKLLKAQLQDAFPKSKWSVRTEFFSMGSAIDAILKEGQVNEEQASAIGKLYADSGNSDPMTDYFDNDNYVHVVSPSKVANGVPVGNIMNSNVAIIGRKYQ